MHWTTVLIATRTCAILSDLIVLFVTWYHTYSIRKEACRTNIKTSLVSLLLRDGTVYFVVLLVLNLLQVITEDVLKPVIKETADYLSIFVPAIESILISRFMMNLRQVYHTSDDDMPSLHLSSWHASSHHQPQSQTQSLEFTSRFVGNMGASLMHESSSMTVATSVDHL
ncbi:hypothetical protein AcW1_002980 [Taiwanofungus camphoratus]|nr:hypothetical protein AcV5_001832 [Antrodia cinnamomea]KAI0942321.1 hypothetical protein AcW1_002980 [Antrodia cinnamomea]